ncbi:hypothetical protein DPMN_123148 [Dreissena polymorpha]|uniref:C-type lectin domain-containing protein n=2 Tax=Dreissena polymorpha TaxID=45954 RepID=A0A9D4GTV5_DREPO|nr:hypothetical protein DPMN_123148 [Dreissena polymorpha]
MPYLEMSSRSAKGLPSCALLCSDDCWYLKYEDDGSGSGTCDLYKLRDTRDTNLKFVNISNTYKKVEPSARKYIGITRIYSWQVAQDNCERFGGKLAAAETTSQLNAIRAIPVSQWLWLGARRNESGWFWLSGVAMDTTPAYNAEGGCLYLYEGNKIDAGCEGGHYSVCELQF